MTKYKVVVPDAITWEFDEIVAGGQNDRYAMTITLAPYGTLINDPKLSKTGGKWAWAVAPGAHSRAESQRERRRLDLRRADCVQEQGMGVRVHPDGVQQGVDAALGGARQRAAAGVGAERTRRCRSSIGWAPVLAEAMQTATLEPREPIWPTMELQLRSGISSVLTGAAKTRWTVALAARAATAG